MEFLCASFKISNSSVHSSFLSCWVNKNDIYRNLFAHLWWKWKNLIKKMHPKKTNQHHTNYSITYNSWYMLYPTIWCEKYIMYTIQINLIWCNTVFACLKCNLTHIEITDLCVSWWSTGSVLDSHACNRGNFK